MAKRKAQRMTEDEITSMMVKRMEQAHWDPAFIYAFKKTEDAGRRRKQARLEQS